jgi:thymidylate synthase
MLAHVCGLEVGEFVHTFGDLHVYKNHFAQVEELLSREPLPLRLLAFRYEHLELVGYKSHGKIEAPVAV